jgi:hypothetical protein
MVSNKFHSMTFENISEEEFQKCFKLWMNDTLMQDAFPMLSEDEREFIMTGITPEEWNQMCPDDD